MSLECILCCDESTLFGITECNHGPFCYRCAYKMRAINKNNSCPICKVSNLSFSMNQNKLWFPTFLENLDNTKDKFFLIQTLATCFTVVCNPKSNFKNSKTLNVLLKLMENHAKMIVLLKMLLFLKNIWRMIIKGYYVIFALRKKLVFWNNKNYIPKPN